MIPQSVLVTQPALSIENLALACSQLFNHRVSEGIDNSPRKLCDAERFLSIIDAMREPGAPASLPPDLLKHVTFSVLTVADEMDMITVLEICSGMFVTLAETKGRGIMVAVITGTLKQWRDAVIAGCNKRVIYEVRAGFNQIHSLFVGTGLGDAWKNCKQQSDDAGTFLLTYER
jgi:hypothetical protein